MTSFFRNWMIWHSMSLSCLQLSPIETISTRWAATNSYLASPFLTLKDLTAQAGLLSLKNCFSARSNNISTVFRPGWINWWAQIAIIKARNATQKRCCLNLRIRRLCWFIKWLHNTYILSSVMWLARFTFLLSTLHSFVSKLHRILFKRAVLF